MINFRSARITDLNCLLKWRNDSSAYENFISDRPVTKEEHREWFINILRDDNVKLFVILNDRFPIGQVRIDIDDGDGIGNISITIDKEHRGKGYAEEGLRKIIRDVKMVSKFIAVIKHGNFASEKLFDKLGFKLCGIKPINNNNFLLYERIYV